MQSFGPYSVHFRYSFCVVQIQWQYLQFKGMYLLQSSDYRIVYALTYIAIILNLFFSHFIYYFDILITPINSK